MQPYGPIKFLQQEVDGMCSDGTIALKKLGGLGDSRGLIDKNGTCGSVGKEETREMGDGRCRVGANIRLLNRILGR